MQAYDVAIVGGGITGCALAFELGRYRVKTARSSGATTWPRARQGQQWDRPRGI